MNRDFAQLIKDRFSVRVFVDTAISKDILDSVLEAARVAPTAMNLQPQRLKVCTSAEDLAKIDSVTPCRFGAATAILVCYDLDACARSKFDGSPTGEIDASIAFTHMMLQAEDKGLGSLWVRHADFEKAKDLFELSKNIVPVSILMLGYKAEGCKPSPQHTARKPIADILI